MEIGEKVKIVKGSYEGEVGLVVGIDEVGVIVKLDSTGLMLHVCSKIVENIE